MNLSFRMNFWNEIVLLWFNNNMVLYYNIKSVASDSFNIVSV